jgi:hypothetical protein
MRQVLAVAALVAVGLLFAPPPAGASEAKGPTLRSLQAQIKGLQKQVTKLKKRVVNDENFIDASLAYSVCSTAVTADTFQDTWTGLDSYFVAHPPLTAYFGAQTVVNDYQACGVFSVVRAHNQRPPNSNVLRALLDIFKPSSLTARQDSMDLAGKARHMFRQFFVLLR